jgi:CRISPR-associated protein Cmr4
MSDTKVIFLHALTPVHSGTGQTAAVIDLPIAREKATGYPMIPASSLKGVLRDAFQSALGEVLANKVFGTIDGAGALCFTDQRLLCLPVRSYFGTYAYVTCNLVLQRLTRDLTALGAPLTFSAPGPVADLEIITTTGSALVEKTQGKQVYLEDLDLNKANNPAVNNIAQALAIILFPDATATFTERFAIVSDEVFSFLCETATEVTARIVLKKDDTKTTDNLWYEEAVPAEAIFCGAAVVQSQHQETRHAVAMALQVEKLPTIQLGGNASVGRGLCRVVVKS